MLIFESFPPEPGQVAFTNASLGELGAAQDALSCTRIERDAHQDYLGTLGLHVADLLIENTGKHVAKTREIIQELLDKQEAAKHIGSWVRAQFERGVDLAIIRETEEENEE